MIKKYNIHREGYRFISATAIILLLINTLLKYFNPVSNNVQLAIGIISIVFFIFIVSFFRIPHRLFNFGDTTIIAPADGKIVVIEEVEEPEYFKDKRIQVSIFMSPTNVHVNRNPVNGEVKYAKYHPGKYLVAWHPKSSTKNERFTVVYDSGDFQILVRQIAGKLARKIVNYLKEGDVVKQCDEFGFIKFGSRVDLFLPMDTEICVDLKQKVKGGITVIGMIPANK